MQSQVSIKEYTPIQSMNNNLINILLKDRTTGSNIIWATDDYIEFGDEFSAKNEIYSYILAGKNKNVIIHPRVAKALLKQSFRTLMSAEVFTPAWLCNEQNNLIDAQWFGRENVFNIQQFKSWKTITEKISFKKSKCGTWKDYVSSRRLEVSCGEAPYLVSRYDVVTGKPIELQERIGLLDRKLRIINENVDDKNEWLKQVERAYQSIYGYEYHGDNLLIARENLLYTFIDNMKFKFREIPDGDELCQIATIISWNIWQMDALTYTIPLSETRHMNAQLSLFDNTEDERIQTNCRIKDWQSNRVIEYASLVRGDYL